MTEEEDSIVEVTIHYRGAATGSRGERRQELERVFRDVEREVVDSAGGAVKQQSLSVSGQTVDAVLPKGCLSEVERELDGRGFRLDVAVMRQVVPPF